jgi:hypothetical protein
MSIKCFFLDKGFFNKTLKKSSNSIRSSD